VAVGSSILQFTVPKLGSTELENEDRTVVRQRRGIQVGLGDGATESALSGEWAEALVVSGWKSALLSKYLTAVGEIPIDVIAGWLEPLRRDFTKEHGNKERPWYARAKVRKGAHATFLAFRMFSGGKWRAVACGDACLIQLSGNNVLHAFPVCSADDFTNSPDLISSLPEAPLPQLTVHAGTKLDGQSHFVLATDALAAWLLEPRTGAARVERLLRCETDEAFAQLVEEERRLGALRNDDTTVVVIRL
jgi:hypothetical protein